MDKLSIIALKKTGAVDIKAAVVAAQAAQEAAEAAQEAAEDAQEAAEDAAEDSEASAATSAAMTGLAPAFSSSAKYAVGDYVLEDGKLYRCTTAVATAGSFDSDDWTQVTLAPDVRDLKSTSNLIDDMIKNTTQEITFDSAGNVQSITHKSGNTTIRTDAFTFADGSITEVRTLNTGESLTIVTNTSTLVTTVTYAAA